jgi:hypothetical protein
MTYSSIVEFMKIYQTYQRFLRRVISCDTGKLYKLSIFFIVINDYEKMRSFDLSNKKPRL